MDIEMPIMGGLECTKKIRELEKSNKYSKTIIYGISSYSEEGNVIIHII